MSPFLTFMIFLGTFVFFAFVLVFCIYYFQIHLYLYNWFLGLKKPIYRTIIERNQLITMRDGVILVGDLYRPDSQGRFPAILFRTPYGKENKDHSYSDLAT